MTEKEKRTQQLLTRLVFQESFLYDKRRYDRAVQTVKETVEHYFGDISKETVEHYFGDISKKTIEHYSGDISADYIHHIKGRVKKLESILEKAERKDIDDPLKVKDIAGVRVVCHNEMDVNYVATFLQKNFKPLEDKLRNGSEDGYRARHLLLEVPVLIAGLRSRVPVEVQIRTIAQDLFATLSHRDVYKKTKPLPPGWKEKFEELGDLLKRVDELGQEMREMLLSEEVTKDKDSTLTLGAVKIIVKDTLVVEINDRQAQDILARCLNLEMRSVKDLEAFLKDKNIFDTINDLYQKILGREVDPPGLVYWGGFLRVYGAEQAVPFIEEQIRASREFREKKGPRS